MSIPPELTLELAPLDEAAQQAALDHIARLTAPPGALGRLYELAVQVAGIQKDPHPKIKEPRVVVMAADHGVAQAGVSAFPQEVTPAMVQNFVAGGAAINVLAATAGARILVVDMGVKADFSKVSEVVTAFKIREGTSNLLEEPAMTLEEAQKALTGGFDLGCALADSGVDVLMTGDMGIANTTASACLGCVFTGADPKDMVGRGTGLDDAGLSRKTKAVQQALARGGVAAKDPLGMACQYGGFEIVGLAGLYLAGAHKQVLVVVDGFISTAALLLAHAINPGVLPYCVAAHASQETGHMAMLDHLNLRPLINLDLRLGEGTGGALVLPIIRSACRLMTEMATFDQAAVPES